MQGVVAVLAIHTGVSFAEAVAKTYNLRIRSLAGITHAVDWTLLIGQTRVSIGLGAVIMVVVKAHIGQVEIMLTSAVRA